MPRRQKWKPCEDKALIEVMDKLKSSEPDWQLVSQQLAALGFVKSTRQARERWTNHLDPRLERDTLKTIDNVRLIRMHAKHGNSWKVIANYFEGRSDNGIKNQFFAMIRKALRKACRTLNRSLTTSQINQIKPRMLSRFLTLDLTLPEELKVKNPAFPWLMQDPVSIREFIIYFLEKKFAEFEDKLNAETAAVISFIVSKLEALNRDYCKVPQKKKKKEVEVLSSKDSNLANYYRPTSRSNLIDDSVLNLGAEQTHEVIRCATGGEDHSTIASAYSGWRSVVAQVSRCHTSTSPFECTNSCGRQEMEIDSDGRVPDEDRRSSSSDAPDPHGFDPDFARGSLVGYNADLLRRNGSAEKNRFLVHNPSKMSDLNPISVFLLRRKN